jgi:hypothetical protein
MYLTFLVNNYRRQKNIRLLIDDYFTNLYIKQDTIKTIKLKKIGSEITKMVIIIWENEFLKMYIK